MLEMNRLHCVDCMVAMRDIPDGYFELAIVDPPYGVGSITYAPGKRIGAVGGFIDKYDVVMSVINMGQRASVKRKALPSVVHGDVSKTTIRDFGDENVSPPPEYFTELFRVSKNQIIWGGNYFLLPPSRCFVIWRKTTVAETFSMAMAEYAWCSFNDNAKVIEAAPQGTGADPRFHPTQKPVVLYEKLLQWFAKPGDKILDTHAGSASCAVACIRKGFDWLAFEINESYCDKAQERISLAWAAREAERSQTGMEEFIA